MKRTVFGLSAMFVSLLLGTVIALGSLVATGANLESTALTPFSAPILLVTCLDPLAILLEIVAIVLVVVDGRQVGGLHHRLAWTAAVSFVIWGVANIGGFIPLSFVGMRRGSLALVKAGQWVKAGAALLQYLLPFLMVFGLTRKWSRVLLCLALALTVAGNFGVVVLPIRSIELEPIGVPGQMVYVPRFEVDYTVGVYPFLLGMGYAGGTLYLVVYAFLTWRTWHASRETARNLV
ncbi:MAG: hypothetical protein JXA14_03955 [Anaerolineae bacterium]|nr:hypothetical protein [Anaerolineae bacterium]